MRRGQSQYDLVYLTVRQNRNISSRQKASKLRAVSPSIEQEDQKDTVMKWMH